MEVIKCLCGSSIQVNENSNIIQCESCQREYQKQPAKLNFLGQEVDEGLTGRGVVII